MFKTSVITDEISQDLGIAIELANRFSLDAVEIRSVYDKGPFDFNTEDLKAMKKQIDSANLSVSAISAPFYKCDMNNEEEIAANLAGLERCIKAADILETNMIRGFAFWKNGELDDCLNKIVELYQKPIQMLKDSGIILALESDPSVNTTNAFELAKVLDAINHPQVKALWDPGNNIYSPHFEIPYPDGYQYIKAHMAHVHLKDAVLDAQNNAIGCCFGEGLVDFKGQMQSLLDEEYQGYVVMETHYRKASVLSKEILERPGGSAFSADGYEPTVECLQSFQEMMNGLKKSSK
ncbi:MAG: sugar phosphate isomerase/epimerase family protein [Oscillospiraceae bacterium]